MTPKTRKPDHTRARPQSESASTHPGAVRAALLAVGVATVLVVVAFVIFNRGGDADR